MLKEKLIIINSENKILFFLDEQIRFPYLFLPTILDDENDKFNHIFIDNDINEEFELIDEIEKKSKICKTENNHLKFIEIKKIKKYYAKYNDLSKEKIKKILQYCYEYNFKPQFLSIDEIIDIINDENLEVRCDKNISKVLTKLQNNYNIR